jgi:diguanylate cyclase (GGDEF)-like protein
MHSTIQDDVALTDERSRQMQPDTPDPRLDCITRLAVTATGSSIGGVSLIFQSQMWMPARYGVEDSYLPRVGSFCNSAFESDADWFEVRDAATDPRFDNHLLVEREQLRHYASVLLRGSGGHRFGTLWVMGEEVRNLDPGQMAQLKLLAEVAAEALSSRYCDSVTGLYNRGVFLHHLQCLLDHADSGRHPTVGYLDLIGFRQLNGMIGRDRGDAILRLIGQRLADWGGIYGLSGHLGGDRFAFALEGTQEETAARVEALRRLVDVPLETAPGKEQCIHARIGIVRRPAGGPVSAGALLDAAEAASHAVGHARNGSVVREYDQAMQAGAQLRYQLHEMQRGVRGFGCLEVHYQPQVDLARGRLAGFEALVRWRHPVLGLVGPNRFIPLAEDSGDIVELDLQVMARVCADLKAWMAQGLPVAPVALNFSRASLLHSDMLTRIQVLLAESGVPGTLLEVEVTESLLLESPRMLYERVMALRALGVRIAVDDFGTGYSNLDTLSSFPFDRLKADRRFVHGVAESPRIAGLLALIRGIAGVFGAELLCEGVERQDDLDWVHAHGIRCVQGWYFAQARPPETVQAWLDGVREHAGQGLDPAALRALLRLGKEIS